VLKGTIKAVCVSAARGTVKSPVDTVVLKKDWGIENDAHAGTWHRQVSLLSAEAVDAFNERGAGVKNGDFGENLLVYGLDFPSLPVGTVLTAGDVVLRMTQIGKKCHSGCEIQKPVPALCLPKASLHECFTAERFGPARR
jgi:molybdopterin adenylyltransferase